MQEKKVSQNEKKIKVIAIYLVLTLLNAKYLCKKIK